MRLVILVMLGCGTGMVGCDGGSGAGDDCEELTVGAGFASQIDAAVAANGGQGGGILRVECTSGRLLWEGAAGNVAENSAVVLRADDAFEIQSTTKAFTAALALTFVEEGQIGLDDPLGSVLAAADTTACSSSTVRTTAPS
jgi:CubicO group peptidase (beta-lactamase class C family)